MKKLVLFVLSFTIMYTVAAQDYWSLHADAGKITTDKSVARVSFPKEFKLFDLNVAPLRQQLFAVAGNASRHSTIISLPNTDGYIEQFEVFEASNFEPDLQARFPGIRAFSGKGISDRSATLKLSISPQGIQTMVFRTEKPNEFIEAYSQDHTVYAVFRSQRTPGSLQWTCSAQDQQLATSLNTQVANSGFTGRSGGDLKTLRLAQSCNAEYSNFFLATSAAQEALVIGAFNATLTRCNGVFERDLALHLNLISNTTSLIYYDPSTDPYSATISSWSLELQQTLTSVIGSAGYDIGHMFGASGGGGNAGCLGCVCVDPPNNNSLAKGSAYTSPADGIPQGDNFDIDFVVHEMGHQLGGSHTFSYEIEGNNVNKEPGSGITIMGYAGITGLDLAPHSIAIFHQTSIAQISANLATKTCPVTTNISANNATPVVNAGSDYTIPISTPFVLTGSATDANPGDLLTYCWEQDDNAGSGQTGANSVASPTKTAGPNWISFMPATSTMRLFPKLATILAGLDVSGPLPGGSAGANTEALSSVSRTLNFRLTVRDNAPYSSTVPVSVGQTQFDDMVVTVSNTSGPFAVTAPNTAVSWVGNSTQTITWSVNNTTVAPVSCANVSISISTDGGDTFSTLVDLTPNDGSQVVTIPNTPSATARVRVAAVGNIFFDISNTNFTITAGSDCGEPGFLSSTAITTSSATVLWATVAGATSYDVDYKLNSSSTWTNSITGITSTSANLSGLVPGATYDWRVRANCPSGSSSYAQSQFTTIPGVPCDAPTGLSSPSATATTATVSWIAVSGANNYTVDYKAASSGTWINAAAATSATSVNLSGLTASTLYDWRVRSNCPGGNSAYAQAQFTTTGPNCAMAFEPNETQATAAAVSSGVVNSAAITSRADVDFFKITTTGTTDNVFSLVGVTGFDYDLYVYNSAGAQIGSGTSSGPNEIVSLNGQVAGTYFFKVIGHNGVSSATCYTITATAVTSCQSRYDVSTNGTSAGAATIPFNTDIKGLINPSADNDYYKFVITTRGTATISLTTLPANYDIRLYSSNGTTELAVSQNGGTLTEVITRAYAAGIYYVRVYGFNNANNAANCYTLRVQLGSATRGEELIVDSKSGAYPNPVTSTLNVKTGQGMSDIKVFDIYGKMVIQKSSTQSITQLDMSALPAGMYMIRVMNKEKETTMKIVKE